MLPTLEIIVDIALAAIVLEAALLVVLPRLGRRAPGLRDVGATLASGLCLLLALRLSVGGAPAPWPLVPLGFALVAHLRDLRSRWPGRR